LKWDKCLIIGFGDDLPKTPPDITTNTLVISIDGGYSYTKDWGLTPNLLVGDLDSIDPEHRQSLVLEEIPILEYPVEKDQTDLEIAVDYAVSLGITEFILTGAWGSRIDHSLGNLEILYKLGLRGLNAQLLTGKAQIFLVNQSLTLELPLDTTVSLLPLTPTVTGVSTEGLYYPLVNAKLTKGQTRTISNLTISSTVKITKKDGILLAIVETENPRT